MEMIATNLKDKKIAVIGCGSIGRRHIANLNSLGFHKIIACDTDEERLHYVKKRCSLQQTLSNSEELTSKGVDAALICTPPNSHVSIAMEMLRNGIHTFVEKPFSHTLEGVDNVIDEASKRELILCIDYNLRLDRGITKIKDVLESGALGDVLSAQASFGQYLPDWRPWQDYKQSYSAKKSLGGGILLDGSHELDYMRWLLGDIRQIACFAGKLSRLEIETEDVVSLIFRCTNNVIGEIHVDCIRPGYSRKCEIIGDKGVVTWDYDKCIVRIQYLGSKKIQTMRTPEDKNMMYIDAIRNFLNSIQGKEKPFCDGFDAKKTLILSLAAKKSNEDGLVVTI
jgi:predicted dehydrogenase